VDALCQSVCGDAETAMTRGYAWGLTALAVLTLSGASGVPSTHSTIDLRPCDVAGLAEKGRCGSLDVHENRTAGTGRKIALNIVVLPATGSGVSRPPVFWLEGGPGGAATQSIGSVSQQYLRALRPDRDLVFVDQRGTGKSNPLDCDLGESPADPDRFYGPVFPPDLVRACRARLERAADLTQYTTSIAMDDLDDVREALGYPTIDLAGASYGTQAALVYMRRHGEHVESAFLVGVVPPDFRLPLPFARAAQSALDLTFADCAADSSCHSAFPDVKHDFDAVLARFDRGSLSVSMMDPGAHQPRTVALARESYVEHIRLLLYSTFGARYVPLVVHQASVGNFLPFQTVTSTSNGKASMARGMYLSVTCSEDVPFITAPEITRETQGTFLGDRRIRAHLAACAEWPRADVPRSFLEPVRSKVPTIFYSGVADGATPPWIAEVAVKFLPRGRQILIPHTGHQVAGACGSNLMRDFFTHPLSDIDASCASSVTRPPFVTALP
jgi:pimeloyl-ACP methyl ester carboxylesterase